MTRESFTSRDELARCVSEFLGFTPCIPPHASVKSNTINLSNGGPLFKIRNAYYDADDHLLCIVSYYESALLDESPTLFPGLPNHFEIEVYGEDQQLLHEATIKRTFHNDQQPTIHYICYKILRDATGKFADAHNRTFAWLLADQ